MDTLLHYASLSTTEEFMQKMKISYKQQYQIWQISIPILFLNTSAENVLVSLYNSGWNTGSSQCYELVSAERIQWN